MKPKCKEQIEWCYKKNMFNLIEPNNNLAKGYLIKSENSLKAMRNEKDNIEWEISAAYYTLYFAIYAIMMEIGVKCENHSCSISFIEKYLNSYFNNDDIKLLKNSRDLRNQVQYYVINQTELINYKETINNILELYLKAKATLNKISSYQIEEIRAEIQKKINQN